MTTASVGRLFLPVDRAVVLSRFPRLLFGLVLFGAGSALQVRSGLGLSPWGVLHEGLSFRTPLTIGTATIVVSFFVLLLWIPLRQRMGVGTLTNAIVIGLATDATLALVDPATDTPMRWFLMLAGVQLVAVGSGFYIGVHLGPGARDGLMTGLADRGLSIRLARTMVEGSALFVGWLLGGTVGIGTVVFALTIGPSVQFFLHRLQLDVDER